MKLFKISFLASLAAMLVMGLTGSAFAFHDGGVADCEGCHTMHNSKVGLAMTVNGNAPLTGNAYLLLGSDPSSTCLSCHGSGATLSSYHVATNAGAFNGTSLPAQYTPGGDFSWLQITGAGGVLAAPASEAANRQGHHIVAADYGFAPNADNGGLAPGGTYPAASLGCPSCHNPHNKTRLDGSSLPISTSGSYGSTGAKAPVAGTAMGTYRFLAGSGYTYPLAPGYTFGTNGPTAVAPSTYNKADTLTAPGAGIQVRVAYGQGMSEWCGNCHAGILNNSVTAGTVHRHVAGAAALLNQTLPDGVTNVKTAYNAYVNSGNTSGGTVTTSYLALVPYELGTSDQATLLSYQGNGTGTDGANASAGPSIGTENVMCLSCHRAHASGLDSSLRYQVTNELMTMPAAPAAYSAVNAAGAHGQTADANGYIQAVEHGVAPGYFGQAQRDLCNKCHAKG